MRKTIRAKGCKQSFCYLENWDSEWEKNGSMNKAKSKSASGLTGINCILKNIKVKISKFKKYYKLRTKKTAKSFKSGFSLIESLLSLSFFLIILVASLEFFVSTRNHFFDLKDEQEVNQAAYTTLDKVRLDLCECGRGLVIQQSFGLLEAISASNNILTIQSRDKDIPLDNNLVSGQTFIPFTTTAGIKKGQKLCFAHFEKGELKTITAVSKQGLTLSSPLNYSYIKDEASVILIRTVSVYLDGERGILRRKVNASPAQPLLEDVVAFEVIYDAAANITSLGLILKTKEEKKYEVSVFSKNMALVQAK